LSSLLIILGTVIFFESTFVTNSFRLMLIFRNQFLISTFSSFCFFTKLIYFACFFCFPEKMFQMWWSNTKNTQSILGGFSLAGDTYLSRLALRTTNATVEFYFSREKDFKCTLNGQPCLSTFSRTAFVTNTSQGFLLSIREGIVQLLEKQSFSNSQVGYCIRLYGTNAIFAMSLYYKTLKGEFKSQLHDSITFYLIHGFVASETHAR